MSADVDPIPRLQAALNLLAREFETHVKAFRAINSDHDDNMATVSQMATEAIQFRAQLSALRCEITGLARRFAALEEIVYRLEGK